MSSQSRVTDINEDSLHLSPPKPSAAGLRAVAVALQRGFDHAGPVRTVCVRATTPERCVFHTSGWTAIETYPTARGRVAAYFPEADAVVHRDLVARASNTPGLKAITVRFERPETGVACEEGGRHGATQPAP